MLYQIYFYTPQASIETIKKAMFKAGAGKVGNYQACAWQVLGKGQFTPLASATPYIGNKEQLIELDEYRVEMVCEASRLKAALTAMIKAHPYQEVAYGAVKIITLADVDTLSD